MKVLIFSREVQSNGAHLELQAEVQQALDEHPDAKVAWLQSSCGTGSKYGGHAYTVLTAIVTF